MLRKFLNQFTLFNLMVIALMAALGIAVKSVIVPLVQLLTGPLYIPGGVVAGGVYMMFLVLAASLTRMRGAATLCGLVQGIMVLIIGIAGSHGVLSILSYTLTGLAVDLLLLILRHKGCCALCCFLGGMAANLTGTLVVNAAFFSLPPVPLVLSLAAGALSGGLGGLLAWSITKQLRKFGVVKT
ncbi:MAG: ECF transporter S component [Clostridiales bacterium]|nr:ECF transporter S component [Clostridiales bacterium]